MKFLLSICLILALVLETDGQTLRRRVKPAAGGPVTYGGVDTARVTNSSPLDLAITIPSGLSNVIVVAHASVIWGSVTSVTNTTDATTLTLGKSQGSSPANHVSALYYELGVGAGTKTYRLTASGSYFALSVTVYYNAAQSDPIRATGGGTATSQVATCDVSSNTDDLVVDGVLYLSGAWTATMAVGAGQTERVNHTGMPTLDPLHGQSEETGAATTTMSWTCEAVNFEWMTAAMSIKRAN